MARRPLPLVVALGAALAALSVNVGGRATVTYPDIMGCERGCEVAAGGSPVPFVADYPGLSPSGSVFLVGAVLGIDRVLWDRLAASLAWWLAVSAVAVGLASRVGPRSPSRRTGGGHRRP